MIMQMNSFSTSLCTSSSVWGKANEMDNKSELKKNQSKIYSDFDHNFQTEYDILASLWMIKESGVVVLNIAESLIVEENIERVFKNYLYFKVIVYLCFLIGCFLSLFLASESIISRLDGIIGVAISVIFLVCGLNMVKKSENKVVNEWEKIKVHHN